MIYTERAQNSDVRRTYACDDCSREFVLWVKRDSGLPDCPFCEGVAQNAVTAPALLTNKSKAIDITQKMAEETYGLTDFNDNQRPGDIAFKGPSPVQTAERDQIVREMTAFAAGTGQGSLTAEQQQQVANFFSTPTVPGPQIPMQGNPDATVLSALNHSRPFAEAARSEGSDPVSLLHEAGQKGALGMKLDVVARAKMERTTV